MQLWHRCIGCHRVYGLYGCKRRDRFHRSNGCYGTHCAAGDGHYGFCRCHWSHRLHGQLRQHRCHWPHRRLRPYRSHRRYWSLRRHRQHRYLHCVGRFIVCIDKSARKISYICPDRKARKTSSTICILLQARPVCQGDSCPRLLFMALWQTHMDAATSWLDL